MHSSFSFLAAASLASGAVIRRRDPPMQEFPAQAKADNTFSNGKSYVASGPTVDATPATDIYGVRNIDLPFGRLYHGDMKFFSAGQLNSPDGITDKWMGQPGVYDSANQSACGIPDNAFSISKVAIHPYFLKYADLSRYCMQDVCISFWNGKQQGQGQSDMMLKVTDVCSTDPNDPTHCAKPGDIKIDRSKAKIMELSPGDGDVKDIKQVNGSQFTDGISQATSETWWFFTKCWADALVQPAYTENWFAQPPIPNNLKWSQDTGHQQFEQNLISYPKQHPQFGPYYNGFYNATYVDTPITDWSPTDPDPKWCPIAGGKGWGIPAGDCVGGSNQASSGTGSSGTGSSSTSSSSTPVAAGLGYSTTSATMSSITAAGSGASSTAASSASNPSTTSTTLQAPESTGPASNSTGAGLPPLTGSGTSNGAQQAKSGQDEDDTCEL